MKSFQTLYNNFTDYAQNTASTNTTRGKQLLNDQHRYLVQKYFDNLYTASALTIGGASLTLTGSLASAATTGTLSVAWASDTVYQQVTFSNSNIRSVLFTQNSTAISWATPLSATATTAITTSGVQAYPLPANVSKIKDVTVNVGQLKYLPMPIMTQSDWDNVNFLPYTSDIPQYYFIYNNYLQIFPIPSTSNNVITYNFKLRVADMTYADYSTGTIALAVASDTVTGTTTSWNATGTYPTATNLTFANLKLAATPPKGDGMWYPIQSFASDTSLSLALPVVNAPLTTGVSYTIGQFPLLSEDFHDMIVYGALMTYFSTIVDNKSKFDRFKVLYTERLALLEDYAGSRTVNVDLGLSPNPTNPNLFIYAQS